MAKDRIVKFCAWVGPRSISIVMTNCPQVGVVKVTWRLHFLANKCSYLENGARQRHIYNGSKTNRKSYMVCQIAATTVTLNDLEGHRLQTFLNAIRRTFVQHLTRFQLTVCSRSLCVSWASCVNRETTDKRIVYAKTRNVDNNKIRKTLFVKLLYVYQICNKYVLLRKYFGSTGVS